MQQTSGLLSRPGLLSGTKQSNKNESAPDVKHLQAPTLGSFLSAALCRLFAVSSHLDSGLSKGYSGGAGEEAVHMTRGYACLSVIANRLPWTPSIGFPVKCGQFWLLGYIMLRYQDRLYAVDSTSSSKLTRNFGARGCVSNTHPSECLWESPMIGKQSSGQDASLSGCLSLCDPPVFCSC